MSIEDLKKKWCAFVSKMNSKGVPLPLLRDPKTGVASVSLTLVFMSFGIVLVGLIGKYSRALDGIDLSQALNLFYACGALYFGRSIVSKGVAVPVNSDPQSEQKPSQSLEK